MTCAKTRTGRRLRGRRHSIREQLAEMYARVLEEHGQERAAAALLAHRLAQCTRASKCGRLCKHLMKSPGVGMVYCVGFAFPGSPPPPDKKYVDDLGRIFPLYDALEDPDFPCPLGLF